MTWCHHCAQDAEQCTHDAWCEACGQDAAQCSHGDVVVKQVPIETQTNPHPVGAIETVGLEEMRRRYCQRVDAALDQLLKDLGVEP